MPLLWEPIRGELSQEGRLVPHGACMFRARVPGGWFVRDESNTFFYADPEHEWAQTPPDAPPKTGQSTVSIHI